MTPVLRSVQQRLEPISLRATSLTASNLGLISLVVAVAAAAILAFYLLAIPPASSPILQYPPG